MTFTSTIRFAGNALLGACFVLNGACSRSKTVEPPPDAAPSVAPAPKPASTSTRFARTAVPKLVAIGDLHGDLDATRRALRLAGAIDEKDAWVGKDLVVVQTGDQIDRDDDDRKILDLFEHLKGEAKKAGGEVVALSGNHELMNAALDFRYVTPAAADAFADVAPRGSFTPALAAVDERSRGRAAAFAPGGSYASMLSSRPVVVKIGDSVFVHGGILPKHVRYGLDRINDEVRDWLSGRRADAPSIVMAEDGPVWTRMYSAAPGPSECAVLEEVLGALGAKRMVVGHTVQRHGLSPACGDRVWRIDTGLSKTYGGKLEVLEIEGDKAGVRRGGT